jgi:ubiquinone/menaquinone biosynthesis C-methylase UbiE
MAAVNLDITETFDYVILAGTLGYLADIQEVLTKLRHVCTPQVRSPQRLEHAVQVRGRR